uniref:Uncharacterized protein n=1 Tax=Strongyloides papillosus TaxID=174720 RepID=A0A0N5C2H3_STREA
MTALKQDTIELMDILCKYEADTIAQMFLVKVDNDYLSENNFNNILLIDNFSQNSTNKNPKYDTVFSWIDADYIDSITIEEEKKLNSNFNSTDSIHDNI